MSDAYFTMSDVAGRDAQLVVVLRGELDNTVARDVTRHLKTVQGSSVVIDLSGLTFIDGGGISALLRAKHESEARGEPITFRGVRGNVRRALSALGLDKLLDTN
jgi:anti-anti-sigma factor